MMDKEIQKQFSKFLKQFPQPKIKNVGSPITKQFIEDIGRKPTHQELKKYIEIIVMPTPDCDLRRKQTKSLHRLIIKNGKKEGAKRYNNPHQIHVS